MTIRTARLIASSTPLYHGSLAVLLLLLSGSTFSLGVFIPQVEAAAQPPHHLDGVWETAMGAMHFLSAPIMILASLYLDAGVNSPPSASVSCFASKTFRMRLLNFVSVIAFASFAASARGASLSNRYALFFGVAMQAFPLAILYLTCVQALMAWFPHQAGVAVGIGHAAFGLGTVGLTHLFSVLILRSGCAIAISLSSLILCAASLLPSILIRWPSDSDVPEHPEASPLLQQLQSIERIPWYHILRLRNFWLYIIALFTTSATYMLNPYYFKLGHLFGRPLDQLVLYFNLGNLAATFFALIVTSLTDIVGFGTGYFFSGSRNIMIFFMLLQTICLYLSIIVNNTLNFYGFVIIKATLKIIVACHVGCAALLARDLFGSRNSCVVFGYGAGLALGIGEAASAWLMAAVEVAAGHVYTPSDYNAFYWIAVMWSIIGLVSIVTVQRHKNTYRFEHIFS